MSDFGYDTSMLVDYFTEDGLTKKTGVYSYYWDLVIFKELVDNALDAIEGNTKKYIMTGIDQFIGKLWVFDSGEGISADVIRDSIYNFENYYSTKRHYITPSRGKQGNGLKTIICICHLKGYCLRWHTADGLLEFFIDSKEVEYGRLDVQMINYGETQFRGIEISNYGICNTDIYREWVKGYSA